MNILLPKVVFQSCLAMYAPMGSEIRITIAHYCSSYSFLLIFYPNLTTLKQSSRG